jgi:ribosomal protein L7/L12
MRASGADVDQIAQALLGRTDSPITAIRAVVEGTGLGLGDAKWVVHRNLDPEVRTAAEHLWDELIDAMMNRRATTD